MDSVGAEREVPMDDIVEVGVYADAADGRRGAPLYLRTHRVRAGAQRITVTVPGEVMSPEASKSTDVVSRLVPSSWSIERSHEPGAVFVYV